MPEEFPWIWVSIRRGYYCWGWQASLGSLLFSSAVMLTFCEEGHVSSLMPRITDVAGLTWTSTITSLLCHSQWTLLGHLGVLCRLAHVKANRKPCSAGVQKAPACQAN